MIIKNISEYLAYSKFMLAENSSQWKFLYEWIHCGLKDNFIFSQTLWNKINYWIT